MKLQFKEDRYGWGDTFYIYDDQNQKKFKVSSSVFLLSKKVEIKDMNKKLVVTIKSEPKSLLKKKFYVVIDGKQVAAITKEVSLIPKFTFEGIDWTMNGLMLREYDMLCDGLPVFTMHEEHTPWGERPVLNISEGVDPALALGVCMAVTYVTNMSDSEGSTHHL